MSHLINLVAGSTTLQLGGISPYMLIDYALQSPGSKLDASDKGHVTESAKIYVIGVDTTGIQVALRALEKMLAVDAPRRQKTGVGDRVYIQLQPDGASEAYRAEILRGRVDYKDDPLAKYNLQAKIVEVILTWTRREFWESVTEYPIPLTNSNYSNVLSNNGEALFNDGLSLTNGTDVGATSGLTIVNHDDNDSGDDSYVAVVAADVGGNLPAPCRVEMTNTHGSRSIKKIHIGLMAYGDATNFTHVLEAESATKNATYAANAADATCSNGNKVTLTAMPTSEVYMLYWTLSTAVLDYMKQGFFKLLMRFSTLPTTTTMKMKARVEVGSSVVWEGEWIALSQSKAIQSLGTPQIAPYLIGLTSLYQVTIKIYAKDAGNGNAALDFLYLMPSDAGYKVFEAVGGENISPDVVAVEDGLEDRAYANWLSPGGKAGQFVSRGSDLELYPAVNQRFYFLHELSDNTAPIDTPMSIKAYYRKRIASL